MSNVKSYTANQLLNRVKNLPSFKGFPKTFWILGVRSNEDQPDAFDDKFYLFRGEQFIMVANGTTNAGRSILAGKFKTYNQMGAAVVKANEWYYNVWRSGKHKGKMNALVQTGGKIKFYRDGNMNAKAEELGTLFEGYIGINFHASTYDFSKPITKALIGEWSAGCQVVANNMEYKKIIDYCYPQWTTTYCLIDEF